MRVLLQRVNRASVDLADGTAAAIGPGLLLLAGVGSGDGDADADRLARKIAGLRVFPGDGGKFDRSLLDTHGEALVVPQFTLYGSCRKGRRPDFKASAAPGEAERLCDRFAERLAAEGVARVAQGVFGAHMRVGLENDGPVTLWVDSADLTATHG